MQSVPQVLSILLSQVVENLKTSYETNARFSQRCKDKVQSEDREQDYGSDGSLKDVGMAISTQLRSDSHHQVVDNRPANTTVLREQFRCVTAREWYHKR